MYATTVYDSTTIITSWGSARETKPTSENSTEVWGNRKNVMQIKVVKDVAVSAVVTAGPDKKTLIRDLNGDLVLDPMSGYNSNVSDEQKIGKGSDQFKSAYNRLHGRDTSAALDTPSVAGTNMSPWEYYRYKEQLKTNEKIANEPAIEPAAVPTATEPPADLPQSNW